MATTNSSSGSSSSTTECGGQQELAPAGCLMVYYTQRYASEEL
jgi:hypothetical protein